MFNLSAFEIWLIYVYDIDYVRVVSVFIIGNAHIPRRSLLKGSLIDSGSKASLTIYTDTIEIQDRVIAVKYEWIKHMSAFDESRFVALKIIVYRKPNGNPAAIWRCASIQYQLWDFVYFCWLR